MLNDRVAVVTGASRGLGAGIARRFARDGATVCLVARDEARLNRLAEEIESSGGTALAVRCDVTSADDVRALGETVLGRLGRVDILVNNAGALAFGSFLEESDEQWQWMLDANLTSARAVTRAFLPSMVDMGAGKVIFVSSNAAKKGFPNDAGYSVAKAGLMALTKVLAVEYGTRGVDVHAILPGLIAETDLGRSVVEDHVERFAGTLDAFYEWANPLSPKGFHPTVDSIVDVVAFLATPAAQVLHGQCLTADYGLTPY
ncbi:SDR family NAD(P)-dependent oxidoreductase [Plantactinospora sp. GCM10030261]|uniref:SDR family NAD(P)-dependent oxidoreductase n=1 Tax=Plantactinospora sp. GCM10030261 TaxID=3273420 RepID=UPI00360EAFDD